VHMNNVVCVADVGSQLSRVLIFFVCDQPVVLGHL
jgi:hypothetical protein